MNTAISHNRSAGNGTGGARTRRPALFRRIIALVMMALLAGTAALAFGTPAQAADDDDQANYSFYQLSSSLAAFFSNASSPDEKAVAINPEVWGSVLNSPGSAGAMLGYVDPDFSFSMEFLNSQISGSSSAVGYDTLIQTTAQSEDASSDSETPGMLDYAHFGATLNAMGLDSMGTGLSLGFFAPIGGGLMMILYIFTGVVDLLFVGIIGVLKALNPFKLFFEAVKAVNPTFAEGMTGGETVPGFMGGLASWIGDWYMVLNQMAWTVIVPLFVGVLLLGLVLSKNMNRGSALKKLFIRVAFIGLGIPLIGSMYTGVLNSIGDASASGSAGSTQVVLSTYVDFQNWAFKSRLYVPEGAVIEWDASTSKPTGDSLAKVRNTALEINKTTNKDWAAISSGLNVGQDESWTEAAILEADTDEAGGIGGYMATLDLLGRYMSGAKIDAASYETAVKGDISTSAPFTSSPEGKSQVSKWFTEFSDPKSGLPGIEDAGKVSGNPVVRVNNDTGLVATPSGATTGDKKYTSPSQFGCETWVSNNSGAPLNCNMSTLSLYNYLNTSFGPDSMTMYSSNKSTSGATREMHNSVTQVGTGVMGGLYWSNSMVLLASFVIIGIGYALSMLFSSIKRTFQLVTAIPFATVGAMSAIAKVIIYTVAMILEVILTLFIYKFIQVFLISLPQIIEMPFAAVLNNVSADDAMVVNLLSGGTISTVMTVLSIVSLIIFTVLALRVRKTLVKSVNEVVTKLVDKFMETNVAPPGGKGGGMMPALAGGLASGAGMAAASKAMGGGAGALGGKKPSGGGNGGPAGVKAGGIPTTGGPNGGKSGNGSLAIGGGAGMDVFGAAGGEGPDGGNGGNGNGGPDGSEGNPGGQLALSEGSSTGTGGIDGSASDQSLANSVQSQGGLSEPGSNGSGDVADTMAGSVEKAQAQYGAKDKAMADGALAGAKTVGKTAEAAGRGMAGDVPGAVSAGAGALGHAQDVQGSAQKAQQMQKDIDAPTLSASAGTSAAPSGNSSDAPSAPSSGAAIPLPAGTSGAAPVPPTSRRSQAANAAGNAARNTGANAAGAVAGTAAQAALGGKPAKTLKPAPSGSGATAAGRRNPPKPPANTPAANSGNGRRAASTSSAPAAANRPNSAPASGRRSAAPAPQRSGAPRPASSAPRPAPARQAPRQAAPRQAPAPARQAPARQAPARQAPAPAPRQAAPRQAPAPAPQPRPRVRKPRKDGDA